MSSISGIGASMDYGMAQMRQEMFKKVDSDGSSTVSRAELLALTDKISEDSGESFDATELLSQYDNDSDGVLSEDEMNSLMESIKPKHERDAMMNNEEQTGSQSSGLDTASLASYLSNSGQDLVSSLISMLEQLQSSISEEEDDSNAPASQVKGMQGAPPPPPPNPEEMFSELDSDSSGTLSSDELQTLLDKMAEVTGESQEASELLTMYDNDSDGTLSSDEMDTMMKAMGPPPPPPQEAMSNSSTESSGSSTLQDALASLLQNSDQNSISSLLKMLKNSSSNNSSNQSINLLS